MAHSVLLKKQSIFQSPNGIGVYEGQVGIMKTGSGYGMPHVTATMLIDADSFDELAQAMMDADPDRAIKSFGAAMICGQRPTSKS